MSEREKIPFPPAARGEPDREELERVWELLGQVPASAPRERGRETDAAWDELSRRVGLAPGGSSSEESGAGATVLPLPKRRPRVPAALRRAAAVAGILVAGAAAWYQVPVTERAGPGERLAVSLPDGSRATLNAGSTLRWRRAFSVLPGLDAGERQVRLEGEAFFDVAHGERPFRVEAGQTSVRVLGTRFNVRARTARVRVAVAEGRVEVAERGRTGPVVLEAGEATRVGADGSEPVVEAVRPERIGAWLTGGLTAVDEPLTGILEELSLRYDARVVLADPSLGTDRLNVYYPVLGSLETVLSDLATQQDLRYRRTADGWEVF